MQVADKSMATLSVVDFHMGNMAEWTSMNDIDVSRFYLNIFFFLSSYHSVIQYNSKSPCYPLRYAKAIATEYSSSPTLKFGRLIWKSQVVPVCHPFLIKQQLQQNSHQVFLLLFQLIELFKAVDNWAHHGFICFSFPVLERLTKLIQLAIKSLRAETAIWHIAKTKGSMFLKMPHLQSNSSAYLYHNDIYHVLSL